jgi:hypothetical protein
VAEAIEEVVRGWRVWKVLRMKRAQIILEDSLVFCGKYLHVELTMVTVGTCNSMMLLMLWFDAQTEPFEGRNVTWVKSWGEVKFTWKFASCGRRLSITRAVTGSWLHRGMTSGHPHLIVATYQRLPQRHTETP